VGVDYSSLQATGGLVARVEGHCHLALFYIHQVNYINGRNGCAVMTVP